MKNEQQTKSDMAKVLGSAGGKKSAKKRFEGLSKAEISEKMRAVRYSKKDLGEIDEMTEDVVQGFKDIK